VRTATGIRTKGFELINLSRDVNANTAGTTGNPAPSSLDIVVARIMSISVSFGLRGVEEVITYRAKEISPSFNLRNEITARGTYTSINIILS